MRIRSLLTGRGAPAEPPGYDPERARTTVTRHRTITHDQRRYDCQVVESVDSSYAVGYGYDPAADSSRVFLLDGGETVRSLSSARPIDADIAADGTALVIESGSDADLTSRVRILDNRGETKMRREIDATVGTSGISADGSRVVAVSKARPPQAHIYDVSDAEATTTDLYMSGLDFESFQQGDDGRRICLSDGSRPHLILDVSGDTVWESDTYRSMRPKLDQVRDWLPG